MMPTPESSPSLVILEQPQQFYRFRYASEIDFDRGRVGGCLRSATDPEHGCVRLRVSNIRSESVASLSLVACTVNAEDHAPHPYYLHGDSCSSGCFRWQWDAHGVRDSVDISLEKLAIVCTKKTPLDLKAAMGRRKADVPLLHDLPQKPATRYKSRNVDTVKLAFSLTFTIHDKGRVFVLPTVLSEAVTDLRKKPTLKIEDVNPTEFSVNAGSEFGMYCRSATTGIKCSDVNIRFSFGETSVLCQPHIIKKHLLVAHVPSIAHLLSADRSDERIQAKVTASYSDFISEPFNVIFDRHQAQIGTAAAAAGAAAAAAAAAALYSQSTLLEAPKLHSAPASKRQRGSRKRSCSEDRDSWQLATKIGTTPSQHLQQQVMDVGS